MEQPSESPLSPLGLQLASELVELRDQQLDKPLRHSAPWLCLTLLIGPFFFVDLCLGSIGSLNGQLSRNQNLLFFCMSIVLAAWMGNIPVQAVLLSCYVVFSPDTGRLRFFIWLGATSLLSVTGLLGIRLGFAFEDLHVGDHEMENAVRFFCAMPTIALAAQLPLWPLRIFLGWQFAPLDDAAHETPPRRQMSIQHMLLATTAVAICLGCLRLAPMGTLGSDWDYWGPVAVFAGIAAGASLLGSGLIWVFTRLQNQYIVWGLAIGMPLIIGVTVFSCLVWGRSWQQIDGEPLLLFAVFSMIALSYIMGIAGGVRLLKTLGWTISPARTTVTV